MGNIFIVGLGGFIGSVLRYLAYQGIYRFSGGHWFPLGTFIVNVLGCFVIGILGGVVVLKGGLSEELKLFIFVGFLGGFTTFSAFGYETFLLIKNDQFSAAVFNVFIHMVICLASVWIGYYFSKLMS